MIFVVWWFLESFKYQLTIVKRQGKQWELINMRHTPQEIEVWYVLPALRREFAKAFLETGMKQKDIAKIMEINEPAISQYLKAKRAKEFQFEQGTLG
ncbi:MAG: hypothetical protein ABIH76_05470, partial [Candidatus Bathyarchaeota archaeon]